MSFEDYNKFKDETIEKYGLSVYEMIDNVIQKGLEGEKSFSEKIGDWVSELSIEKNNVLNHTYHFSFYKKIENNVDDIEIALSFYTGVDVGCALVHYSIEGEDLKNKSVYKRVIVDIEIDWSKYIEPNEVLKAKLNNYLKSKKDLILKEISKSNYDDYVTGGGNLKIKEKYKEFFDKINKDGFYWKPVYDTIEVERRFI